MMFQNLIKFETIADSSLGVPGNVQMLTKHSIYHPEIYSKGPGDDMAAVQ